MAKVKVYSTEWCMYCKMAKEFFKEKKIEFEEIDVGKDKEAAEEMVKLSGQRGVPVIVIDGEVITGFDKEKIKKL